MKRVILPLVGCLATGALAQAPLPPAPPAPAVPPAPTVATREDSTERSAVVIERRQSERSADIERRERLQRQKAELEKKLQAATAAKDTTTAAKLQMALARLQAESVSLHREPFRPLNLNGLFVGEDAISSPVVALQLNDNTPREAFQRVLELGKLEHEFVGEIPNEPRLSLKVAKIRANTALNLVGEVAGVGIVRVVKGEKTFYRIGGPSPRQFSAQPILESTPILNPLRIQSSGRLSIGGEGRPLQLPAPATSYAVEHYFLSEERAGFNCPHCKGQVTVLRKRQQPDCSKCSRQFQPGWQYCPNDGTKRPETETDWKFCPLCGKAVKMQRSEGAPLSEGEFTFEFTPEPPIYLTRPFPTFAPPAEPFAPQTALPPRRATPQPAPPVAPPATPPAAPPADMRTIPPATVAPPATPTAPAPLTPISTPASPAPAANR